MKKRIFHSMAFLVIFTMVLTAVVTFTTLSLDYYQGVQQIVRHEMLYIKTAVERNGLDYLSDLQWKESGSRVTWIDQEGDVLFDSAVSQEILDNHLNRPEIEQALQQGSGEAVRLSDTMGRQTFYSAVRLADGSILRVSSTTNSLFQAIWTFLPWLLLFLLLIIVVTLRLAEREVSKIILPINEIDLEQPILNEGYDELAPLLRRIAHQQKQIREQMDRLVASQQEFDILTSHMEEGLVILNGQGDIVTVNPRAMEILQLGQKESFINKHFLSVNRSLPVQRLLEQALRGHSAELMLPLHGQHYQIMANAIRAEEEVQGVVLLILNVTERQQREQLRQEFTANVSHELKTPLTAISGYAEIIQQGLVKEEDIPRFAEKIYSEASRLLALIGDIIKLSKLDEQNVNLDWEQVDLLTLAQEVGQRLQPLAEQRQVRITVVGETAQVKGIRQILSEICYNLLENAIKYNREAGWVKVTVLNDEQYCWLTVEDNGIGIPLEDQERIFERFYRVDKSHTKATGGTGLGLAIVKRSVFLHHGEIRLESKINQGTKIMITLPKN